MAPEERAGSGKRQADPEQGSGLRVLIVEDEGPLRELVARALTKAGYEVVKVALAHAALRVLEDPADRVDLVVSDLMLPQMSGFEFSERARQARPELPFLFVSGYLDPDLVALAPELGATFLAKPFTVPELLRAVASLHGPESVSGSRSSEDGER